MTHTARSIVRFFGGLVLWWLFFAPAFFGIWTPLFIASAALALMLWLVCTILPTSARILDFPFFAAILAMAVFNQNKWLLPPALMGGILLFASIALIALRQSTPQKTTHPLPHHFADIPPIRRFAAIFAIWGLGTGIAMFFTAPHAHIVLMFWTCLMFVLFNEITILAANTLWIGYKTRRECFVSSARWRLRFIGAAVMLILWTAFCLNKVAF